MPTTSSAACPRYDTMLTGNGAICLRPAAAAGHCPGSRGRPASDDPWMRPPALSTPGREPSSGRHGLLMYGRRCSSSPTGSPPSRNSNAIMVLDHGRIVERRPRRSDPPARTVLSAVHWCLRAGISEHQSHRSICRWLFFLFSAPLTIPVSPPPAPGRPGPAPWNPLLPMPPPGP